MWWGRVGSDRAEASGWDHAKSAGGGGGTGSSMVTELEVDTVNAVDDPELEDVDVGVNREVRRARDGQVCGRRLVRGVLPNPQSEVFMKMNDRVLSI